MNEVQGVATFYVLNKTDLNVEGYLSKFHEENIIDMKVTITLSDGSVHTLQVCEYVSGHLTSFFIDGEEVIDEDIDMKNVIDLKKKVTKSSDSVTKVAL